MRFYKDFDLTDFNSYRIKSYCAYAFFPESEEDIQAVFSKKNRPKIIIGDGNNIILAKDYYKEDFLILSGTLNKVQVKNQKIYADAGVTMKQLSEIAAENSLTGLEAFFDIPSSLGGAIIMNAGTGMVEIKNFVESVGYYDTINDNFHELKNKDIRFKYRYSFFQDNPHLIVTKASLNLTQGKMEDIKEKMNEIKLKRWEKQPRDYPNAGSVFKRPKGKYVGQMIEELGLKGKNVGGAKISEKHAGFIINYNNATGKDILKLTDIVKNRIYKKYNIDLEIEQRII